MDEDVFVQIVQPLIDEIFLTLELENLLLQDIFLDDDDNEDDDPGNIVLQDNPGVGHHENAVNEVVDLVRDILYLEDEEEALLEDDRQVREVHHLEIDINRFRVLEDPYFFRHFRMNKGTFELLVVEFGNHLVRMDRLDRLRTGLDVCLLMSLWIMGNISSFRGTGAVFGVSQSVVHFHYTIVIEALRELAGKFIKWPNAAERARISDRCQIRTGFPGVIGMMDGTQIKVTKPVVQGPRYFDYHHNYSIKVLAICDARLRYRHVYVGEAGSVHDARVFKRSPIYDALLERDDVIGEDEHLLADSAYTLLRQVLIPYRFNGNLTVRQRRYNFILSSLRMCIERSFGVLKEKWRRLYRFHVRNHQYALDHIMATLMLHNFVLYDGQEPDGMDLNVEEEDDVEAGADVDRDHPLLGAARAAGVAKREAISMHLPP